jgi:hypothetical protein
MDGTTTTNDGAAEERWSADAPAAEQPQLLATAVGDSCANCGTRLASDQHYCVECGERRGKPRYALAGPAALPAQKPPRAATPRGSRWSGSGTLALIAGVGVLLMAMGVGVLIGRSSNGSSSGKTPTIVIPSAGASGSTTTPSGAAAAAAATAAGASTAAKSSKAATTNKHGHVTLTKVTKAKLKVIPKQLQSAVAKTGTKCASGGVHTGTFFTPGGTNKTGCTK